MEFKIVRREQRTIAGLAIRTANDDPQMPTAIGDVWQKFFQEGVYQAIEKTAPAPLGLYTDYENDEKGAYTLLVGCQTDRIERLPEGTVVKTIPAGRYAEFTLSSADTSAVAEFWQELWKTDLPRSFQADYEEYPDPTEANGKIKIYIGLLPIQSHCGILCDECAYAAQTGCQGCMQIERPFWGECEIMRCCREQKHGHCGECAQFPCETLHRFAYDAKQGDNGKRIAQCGDWSKK